MTRRFSAARGAAIAFGAVLVLCVPFPAAPAQDDETPGKAAPPAEPAAKPAPPLFQVVVRDPGASWKELVARLTALFGDRILERELDLSARAREEMDRFLRELAPGKPLAVLGFPPPPDETDDDPMVAILLVPAKPEEFGKRLPEMDAGKRLSIPEADGLWALGPEIRSDDDRRQIEADLKAILSDPAARERLFAPVAKDKDDVAATLSGRLLSRLLASREMANFLRYEIGIDWKRILEASGSGGTEDGGGPETGPLEKESDWIAGPLRELVRIGVVLVPAVESLELRGRLEKDGVSASARVALKKGTLPEAAPAAGASKAAALLPDDGTVFAALRIPAGILDRLAALANPPAAAGKPQPVDGLIGALLRGLGTDAAFEIRARGTGIATLAAVGARGASFPDEAWKGYLRFEDRLLSEAFSMAGPIQTAVKESPDEIEGARCVRREVAFDIPKTSGRFPGEAVTALSRFFGFYDRTHGRVRADVGGMLLATSGRGAGPDLKGMIRRAAAPGKAPEPLAMALARHGEGVHALLAIPPARAFRHSAEILRKAGEGVRDLDRELGPYFGAVEGFEAPASDEPVSVSLAFGRDEATIRAFAPLAVFGRIRKAIEEAYMRPRSSSRPGFHRGRAIPMPIEMPAIDD